MDTEDLASRVEEWSSGLQEDIDTDKATIEAVNIFMVVAAFVAGIQAQIISLTIALPRSALQRAANLFAFVGLVFEIAGTFLGAVHSILLQRRSKNNLSRQQKVTLFKADLKTIIKWYAQKLLDEQQQDQTGGEVSPGGHRTDIFNASTFSHSNVVVNYTSMAQPISQTSDSQERRERLERIESFIQGIQHYPLFPSQDDIINAIVTILQKLSLTPKLFTPEPQNDVTRQPTQLILNSFPSAVRPVFTFGNMPLISMGIGVAFLSISTILLAAASQAISPEVWIACTVAFFSVISLSFLPFGPRMLKEMNH